MFAEWERATAMGVAALRQQGAFFDQLVEQHDRAYGWLDNNELVFEARELLHNAYNAGQMQTPDNTDTNKEACNQGQMETSDMYKRLIETGPDMNSVAYDGAGVGAGTGVGVGTGTGEVGNGEVGTGAAVDWGEGWGEGSLGAGTTGKHTHHLQTQGQGGQGQGQGQVQVRGQGQGGGSFGDFDAALVADGGGAGGQTPYTGTGTFTGAGAGIGTDTGAGTTTAGTNTGDAPTSPLTPSRTQSPTALQLRLHALTANRDEVQISIQTEVVNQCQLAVLNRCIEIEKLVADVAKCVARCTDLYQGADTTKERHTQFDEFGAMMGEGRRASDGFYDWRGRDITGVRPIMLGFFIAVQELAGERLTLLELETPGGRGLGDRVNEEVNLGRWKLMWAGHDVVTKVLHCFDFLRKSRELSEWYGPSFYFVANPLMLPFPLHRVFGELGMESQVRDQRRSVPHLRLGNVTLAKSVEWQHQQYLNQFRRSVDKLCKEHW
ncbi:hypothetical protein B484DRAFT_414164 [Ochromonadaceae sp. CCMP2298]|nr:hypothetical protein B484DRAFT_414164 [Ochromonadaceae sp. CCMP2298]